MRLLVMSVIDDVLWNPFFRPFVILVVVIGFLRWVLGIGGVESSE